MRYHAETKRASPRRRPDASTVGYRRPLVDRGLAPDLHGILSARDGSTNGSSFDATALEEVRSLAPDAALASIFDENPDADLERATALECESVHPSTGLCAETDVLERIRRREFDVNV